MPQSVALKEHYMMISSAQASSLYREWCMFWDHLEASESLWAKRLSDTERDTFELMIEAMVIASLPHQMESTLQTSWRAVNMPLVSFKDRDLMWNISDDLADPEQQPEIAAQNVFKEVARFQMPLQDNDAGVPDWNVVGPLFTRFISEVRYCALCTVWKCVCQFSDYFGT